MTRVIEKHMLYTQAAMSTLMAVFPGAPINLRVMAGRPIRVELLWDADEQDEQDARNALMQAELAVMESPEEWMEVDEWL